MDLRALSRRLGLPLAVPLLLLATAAPAAAQAGDGTPGSTAPRIEVAEDLPAKPRGYELTAREAIRIARRDPKVIGAREGRDRLEAVAEAEAPNRWQVGFVDEADGEVAQVIVDGGTGEVLESWTGYQVAWQMARGYEGSFGHKLNAPYVWIPLAAIFLLGLLDWRRPRRIVHLDLLALLGFGVSQVFFQDAEIGVSVPLAYPPLVYLLGRMLWIGFRGMGEGLRPTIPIGWLAIATVFLIAFRVTLNVADSGVIDVGYAGVIGADRIADGEAIYGAEAFPDNNPSGDTYGPANYYAYLPFEQALPWSGAWDGLPAAHAAAIFFDLATIAGLFVLGWRMRGAGAPRESDATPSRRFGAGSGTALGVTLAFAWVAFPYTDYVLQSNSNDALVSALLVWALVLFSSAWARGALLALAAATKFAPLALVPLFATGSRGLAGWLRERTGASEQPSASARAPAPGFVAGGASAVPSSDEASLLGTRGRWPSLRAPLRLLLLAAGGAYLRPLALFALAFVAIGALLLAHPAVDPGLATFWERTIANQADRSSPFSIWGQTSLEGLHTAVKLGAVALAVLLAFLPRSRTLPQLAALAAGVLIATQLAAEHWFYLYIVWFLPPLLAALAASEPKRSERLSPLSR